MSDLFGRIENMKGVAEKRATLLHKLDISTPYDLLHHYPYRYLDFRNPLSVSEALRNAGEENLLILAKVVQKFSSQRLRPNFEIFKFLVSDGNEELMVVLFNQFYAFQNLKVGESYYFLGKLTAGYTSWEMRNPAIRNIEEAALLEPVYHLTKGLYEKALISNMKEALLQLDQEQDMEILPQEYLKQFHLMPYQTAMHQVHFPQDMDYLKAARRRLGFDEMLELFLGLSLRKKHSVQEKVAPIDQGNLSEFYDTLPFTLTQGQKDAISEIASDLKKTIPMNRLLQGDVGSGKTVVAAAACFLCVKSGFQAAFMAPTEILATQHYATLQKFLEPFHMKITLLTGGLKAKERRQALKEIADGTANVIVGTHAIFQKSVEFSNLSLVITDEQHRFGVKQRKELSQKGTAPHALYMSATPIPRTLALMIYGDLEISKLTERPKGRLPIKTYAVMGSARPRIYHFLREEIQKGRQAYIVCAAISESDFALQAAESYAEKLAKEEFVHQRVGLLHGKMTAQKKDAVMEQFVNGAIDLLVSTTVIEVGVDVPNATVMVIENAERFGLSQMHQLRGRVGRGAYQSHCILITEQNSDDVVERLKIFCKFSDGFEIAEEDLKKRGPGDFFGSRQHGLPPLKMGSLSDSRLIEEVKMAAKQILEEDPTLSQRKFSPLKNAVERLFHRQDVL